MQITGLLPLNKPVGMRSTRCVELARRILGRKVKVGHGGTLDSTASGLLVLLIGSATRLSNFVMDMPKSYVTVVQLGSETTTDDASGDIISSAEWSYVKEELLDSLIVGFMGWRMQTPPKISAVHVDGQRAHLLTREGQDVTLNEKPVYFAGVKRMSGISDDGKVSFLVHCRKGTYIRSFARDIGTKLGCGAHVCELHRLTCGPFAAQDCRTADRLFEMDREKLLDQILPVDSVCSSSACYLPNMDESKRLANGLEVSLKNLKRMNYGSNASTSGNVIVSSEFIFSICELAKIGGSFDLKPAVNIIYDRSI